MEALHSTTTSIPLYRTDILAPAPSETLYQINPEQARPIGHAAAVGTIDLATTMDLRELHAQAITRSMPRPETLADVVEREATPLLDILPTIMLPPEREAVKATQADTITMPLLHADEMTPEPRGGRHVAKPRHRATKDAEQSRPSWRGRLKRAVGTVAMAGVLATAAPATVAEASPTHHEAGITQAVPATNAEAGKTKMVMAGGEPIMGVSPRQQEIINDIPGLSAPERAALARYTVGVHKVSDKLDGVNPNVMLAMAAHESNLSKSGLASRDHNLFGMKGSYKGKSSLWKTWEQLGSGSVVHIKARFKKYPGEAESMKDFIDQQHRLGWFRDATQHNKSVAYRSDGDYLDHILDHEKPGQYAYATDKKYKSKILDTIARLRVHELIKIDKTPVREVLVPVAQTTAEIKKPVAKPEMARATKISRMRSLIAQYAWPVYRPAGTRGARDMRKAYADAMDDTSSYTGGDDGIDCGAFVTTVMRESGADPTYNSQNGNTYMQKNYLESHDDVNVKPGEKVLYHRIKPNEKLQGGAIAIKSNGPGTVGHTFFYVGKDQPGIDPKTGKATGFKGVLASASLGSRAPMASNSYNRNSYEWFILK